MEVGASVDVLTSANDTSGSCAVAIDLQPTPAPIAPGGRAGIWAFRWDGDDDPAHAGVAALQAGVRGATVELLVDGTVVDHATIKTVTHSLSKTRGRLVEAAAAMAARALKLVSSGIELHSPGDLRPSLKAMNGLSITAKVRNAAGRLLREAWEEQWQVGILRQTADELVGAPDLRSISWLPARDNGYHADPFGLVDGGQDDLILAEAYDFDERLGYIVSIDRDGKERTVLREPFHLSFPQLVDHAGQRWLLPEAKAAGCLRLYRPDPFPDRFVPGPVLIEGLAAADPTLFGDEHGFWLFAGDGAAQDETTLVLYHAADLLGPWRPHPMNPIKIDLGSARPAGPLFRANGKLWRPAQDCRRTYGGAIVLNEVLVMTPQIYLEREGPRLTPDPDGPCPDGMHTLTPFGTGFLVDGKREYRSLKRLTTGLRALAHG